MTQILILSLRITKIQAGFWGLTLLDCWQSLPGQHFGAPLFLEVYNTSIIWGLIVRLRLKETTWWEYFHNLRVYCGLKSLTAEATPSATQFFRGRWKRSSIFQTSHPRKKVCSQKLSIKRKIRRFFRSFTPQKFKKFWWKLKKWQTFF